MYHIKIGEPYIENHKNCYKKHGITECSINVKTIKMRGSPVYGFLEASEGNTRSPGYTQMKIFAQETGLFDFFFDRDKGLLRRIPGVFPIMKGHLKSLTKARENWEKTHPDCKNLLPSPSKTPEDYQMDDPRYTELEQSFDWNYAKLLWYEWWFEWALENCHMPVICNY